MARKPRKNWTTADIQQSIENTHNFGLNVLTREIFLHSHISDGVDNGDDVDEPGVDYRVTTNFIKNLSILESLGSSKITIKMNLCGGCEDSGYAIYDAIKNCKSQTTIIALAPATSMSGIIFQSSNLRLLARSAYVMIHYGSIGFQASASAASQIVKFNDIGCKKMLNILAKRAINGEFFKMQKIKSIQQVEQYLDAQIRAKGDWLLNSTEAVSMGLADQILD